jgi:hypothetical protein
MVAKALEYCEKGDLLPDLLAEVRRANPAQYRRFAARLGPALPAGEEPEVAAVRPRPGQPRRESILRGEADPFTPLVEAARHGRLLLLWGMLPFPLADRPPANRALALAGLAAGPELPARWAGWLPGLPPLPILSLDASDRLERAFAVAGVSLQAVHTRRDVPNPHGHCLFKLAGDLPSRRVVVLSRAEVRALPGDPDSRYLLDEARRTAAEGTLLLLGCDPADEDFRAWWAVLATTFRGTRLLAVGDPSAPWPVGVTCLGADLEAIGRALAAA